MIYFDFTPYLLFIGGVAHQCSSFDLRLAIVMRMDDFNTLSLTMNKKEVADWGYLNYLRRLHLADIKAIGIHNLAPRGNKISNEFLLVVILRIDFSISA